MICIISDSPTESEAGCPDFVCPDGGLVVELRLAADKLTTPNSSLLYIVYNRVNLHVKATDESKNSDKSRDATKAIKLKYGLTFSPKKKLYEDAIAEMKPKIQAAMYRCKSWDEFRRRLAPAGIIVELYNDHDTGKPQGIRFSDGKFAFNGSKIDRAFSYKRLDKFFAKNAGIRETQPQRPAPISVAAKVKESPVANVVENIIETGCQALGGLFQVGSGYDADGIRNMMLREEAMMVGDKHEQDSIKTMTIHLERRKHAERTHVYFRPSDPWTPESNNLLW